MPSGAVKASRISPRPMFCRLGSLDENLPVAVPSENQQGGKEGTPFFKVSDMNLPGNEQVMLTANHYVTAEQIKKNGYRPISTKAILFAKVGAAIFHERKRIAQDFLMDNNMMAFLPSDLPIDFTKHLFDRVRLSKYAQVGALPSYNASDIGALKVHIPELPEQRKIAEFLTAVDRRIGQLSQKKALLEDYKKGVMQQLFTQALRFKNDHGNDFSEWEEKRLRELCATFKSGKGITSEEIEEDGEYPVYGGNGRRGYTNTFTHDGEFLLIGRQGALCGNINRVSGKSYISEHAIAVAGNELANTEWLAQRLYHLNLNRLSESSAQPGLAVNKLERLKLLTPSLPEQTKIAKFLTALDRKIESVSQQITHTQTFKKGLLQQMFV
jgi:type I restriction enzyme S subunit